MFVNQLNISFCKRNYTRVFYRGITFSKIVNFLLKITDYLTVIQSLILTFFKQILEETEENKTSNIAVF